MRSWTLTCDLRPWTANHERRMHHYERARRVRDYRLMFALLAGQARIPRLERVTVTAQPLSTSRRSRPDVAACYPPVKAAIDGIVDAGVLDDDDDEHLLAVTFLPLDYRAAHAGLRLVIEEQP